jgi:hypothetical protein
MFIGKDETFSVIWFCNLAGPTGLEPATSDVTGQRSSQLNYDPAYLVCMVGGTGLEPVTPSL